MSLRRKGELLPYSMTRQGFEAVYNGDVNLPDESEADDFLEYGRDDHGNVYTVYSSWGFANIDEENWSDEIRFINSMQESLGPLSDQIRRIRAHIASLQCCDSGIPVTIDEILNSIGTGVLPEPAFHPGCWLDSSSRTTQPDQAECMQTIEDVVRCYLSGHAKEELIGKHPDASSFINRTIKWLGPAGELSNVQKLMLERFLLPFEFFTGRTEDHQKVHRDCFEPDGRGDAIDIRISTSAGLPKIYADFRPEFRENLNTLEDESKRELYIVCCAMAHGLHGLSDCHHSSFRWIESWIHGIGNFSLKIPGRRAGVEGRRLGQLQFGYALGIDRWLQDIPMHWFLLDLGHVDLDFNPKNEILRVYSYLGDKSPVKEWLAACLWFTLVLERPASLYDWGHRHKELMSGTESKGLGVRQWMKTR